MTAPDPPESTLPIGAALRRVFAKGYRLTDLRTDLLAGTVVGIVAVPLSMALAIAVGVPPQHGLYTAIVAGAVVALLGGCKFQVTGPTAAFVVILAPIASKHGLAGLLSAGFMAGLMLIAMGMARLGNLIRYIPHPVTTGFTTGIATVIATLQLKDVFGLRAGTMPDPYIGKIAALWGARSTASARELGVAAVTLALLLLIPRVVKRIPAPLIAIGAVSLGSALLHRAYPDFAVATIGSRFHTIVDGVEIAGIPSTLPSPSMPWGVRGVGFGLVQDLLPAAFAIAMLGAIESLLSAVIADGMTDTKHDPNSELVALGIGNVVAPIFGGIAATGALARTATNIRTGARSPFAAVTHAVVVLLAMLVLAPGVSYVPMASLAALLLLVAWNMSEIHGFIGVVKIAPKSDVFVLVTCFGLTVFFDMVIAVSVGFVLAAILFMRRMSELTESHFEFDASREGGRSSSLPDGVMVYEINGPLFFGAAQKALATLRATAGDAFHVLVIRLERVPVIDATGLVALENAISSVLRAKKKVVLAGPLPKPHRIFDKAELEAKHQGLFIRANAQTAMEFAVSLVDAMPSSLRKTTANVVQGG
ncbi:C4-dicarboxylic acid transporter DauA [Pendulispora brunnea]|uniref:C4-dicarboxylic acid transporter DauA n=1 Tax=Pendulispora brunnea TaxID=2905690 RepID=A0ABZ2KC57_9BACT